MEPCEGEDEEAWVPCKPGWLGEGVEAGWPQACLLEVEMEVEKSVTEMKVEVPSYDTKG